MNNFIIIYKYFKYHVNRKKEMNTMFFLLENLQNEIKQENNNKDNNQIKYLIFLIIFSYL